MSPRIVAGRLVDYCEVSFLLNSRSPILIKYKCFENIQPWFSKALSFDAEAHSTLLHEIFDLFGIEFGTWTLVQVVDDCSLNKKIMSLQINCTYAALVIARTNKLNES